MTIAALLSVMAVHLAAAISPGPAFVVALRVAASDGLRAGLALALGFGVGAVIWATAALMGLSVLFALAPGLLTGLKIVGAAFLLIVAALMWRHADAPANMPVDVAADTSTAKAQTRSLTGAFRLGFLTQIANPKAAVFFGAVFIGLVPPDLSEPAIALLLAAILVVETGWYAIVAPAFSLPTARTAYIRLKASLDRLFGGLIALFGLRIALG